jgi:hypothetical protein
MQRAKENNLKPLCRTRKGCPIEDLAKDGELTRVVNGYFGARALMQYEHLNALAVKELEKFGLTSPTLLIELETRVQKYIKSIREKEDSQKKLNNDAKKIGGLG